MACMAAPRAWTAEEDNLLRRAVAEHGDGPGVWKTIAEKVPGRTNKACRKRWLHSLSPTVKKTPWTSAEDALLLKYYAVHSPPRWSFIAKHILGRTDDACAKRYREALDPSLKREEWTPDEDNLLLQLTTQLGSKWTQVGQAMGRSGLACRNRWRLLERKQRSKQHDHPAPSGSSDADSPHSYPVHNTTSFSSDSQFLLFSSHTISLPSAPLVPPAYISSISSLNNALVPSSSIGQRYEPPPALLEVATSPIETNVVPPNTSPSHTPDPDSTPLYEHDSYVQPSPSPSPSPEPQLPEVPSSLSTQPREQEDSCPRLAKRPRLRRLHGREQSRLSSHLPADTTRSILPYACGHSRCWPPPTHPDHASPTSFATAAELAEHRRIKHADDFNTEGKLFRCALEGCGKGWKNINGIQYHLQISKAHFQQAIGRYNTTRLSPCNLDPNPIINESVSTPMTSYGPDNDVSAVTMSRQQPSIITTNEGNDIAEPTVGSDIPSLRDFAMDPNATGTTETGNLHSQNASLVDRDNTTSGTASPEGSPTSSVAKTATRTLPKRPYKRRPPKQLACPHEGCPNVYKQRTGLQYHLTHGHPSDLAQLDIVPPVLMRKVQGTV